MSESTSGRAINRHVGPDKVCHHYDSYGLTCDEYDQLRARADGRCEICGTPEGETPRGALIIEHYHHGDLWFVRGLACDRCNGIMARHDRALVWGETTRPWAEKAAHFHRNSWGATPEQLDQAARDIAARKPFTPRLGGYRPELHDLDIPKPP